MKELTTAGIPPNTQYSKKALVKADSSVTEKGRAVTMCSSIELMTSSP